MWRILSQICVLEFSNVGVFLMYQSQRPRGKLAGFWGNATEEVISLQHLGNTILIGNHSSSAACDYIIPLGRKFATRFFSDAEIYNLS